MLGPHWHLGPSLPAAQWPVFPWAWPVSGLEGGGACPMAGVVASRELSAAPRVSPELASHGRCAHLQELARTGAEPGVAGETQPPRAPQTDAGGQSASCRQARPWRSLQAEGLPEPRVLRAEKSQPLSCPRKCPGHADGGHMGTRGGDGHPQGGREDPPETWPGPPAPRTQGGACISATPSAVFRHSGL